MNETITATDGRLWVLAVLLVLTAMFAFIGGITLANREHRKDTAPRPLVPPAAPAPQAVATRTDPAPQTQTGAVVHVHLPAMGPAWQTPVLNGQPMPALVTRDDTP